MSNYICLECSYEGDDPVCPHCNIPCESLKVEDDGSLPSSDEKYPEELLSSDEDGKLDEKEEKEIEL